jgi:hypothetical protein
MIWKWGKWNVLILSCLLQKNVSPFHYIHGIFRCWSIHLVRLVALGILLILVDLCIFTMGRWHWCCVGAWVSCDCGVSCIVGVIGVTCCGGRFSCSTQVVLEMPLRHFHGTFKCVAVQFVNGAPLARCDDHCWVQLCIGALILTLFLLVLISKHSRVSIQVLLEVQICVSYMKTKKSKNVLNLDSVQVNRFLALHLKQKIQQSRPNLMWH